jgi:hypothetical protein
MWPAIHHIKLRGEVVAVDRSMPLESRVIRLGEYLVELSDEVTPHLLLQAVTSQRRHMAPLSIAMNCQ